MENSLTNDFALVFSFGTNGEAGKITVKFNPDAGMESVTNEILRLFQLRANLRNIDGVVRKSGMLPLHRRFTLAFYCMGTDISSSIQGETFSPKCLTTTVNQVVEKIFDFTIAESETKVRLIKGNAVLN